MSKDKSNFNHKQIVKEICDFMGEDIDAPACREVAEHLETCPTCQIQLDTIKRTVTLCREMEENKKLSEGLLKITQIALRKPLTSFGLFLFMMLLLN